MTNNTVEEKIQKAKITPDGFRLVPYPHQDSDNYYPEWKKYGKLFEDSQTDGHQAVDYVRAYNKFRKMIIKREKKIKAELLKKAKNLPTHELKGKGDIELLVHREDILKLLEQ